jgi:hypothetical protein
MSYHVNDDGSVTFSDVPDDAERRHANATASRKMHRERGSKVEDKDDADDKDHKSHPRTTAAKGSAVPRETGTKVVEETELPPMPD